MADRLRLLVVVASAATWPLTSVARAEEGPDVFQKQVRPVLKKKCYSCHSGEDAEAGFDLAKFKSEADAIEAQEAFHNVFERINRAEMPPEGSPGLEDGERFPLLGWIEKNRKPDRQCAELASDGAQFDNSGHV